MTIFYSYVQLPEGTTYNMWLCWEDGGWCLSATVPVVKPEGSPALWSATTHNFFTYDLAVIWILVLIASYGYTWMICTYVCMSLGFYHIPFYHSENDDSISHFLLVSVIAT